MPPTPLPETDRAAANRIAVRLRRERAEIKRRLKRGDLLPLEVVGQAGDRERHRAAATLRITDFLRALPGIGAKRADQLRQDLKISDKKRLGALGRRQRNRLIDYLQRRGGSARGGSAGPGRLVVLAGPTAVGKGTVSQFIRDHFPQVHLSVSATTRQPRPGEREGYSYYFVDDRRFDRMIEEEDLLEWATVHNRYRYGTPRTPVVESLKAGRSVLLEIDIQGARQVRSNYPEALLVFLLPPTWEELVRRLVGRGTETAEEQERRLRTARVELAAQDEFDVKVVNDSVADAARAVVDLLNPPDDERV